MASSLEDVFINMPIANQGVIVEVFAPEQPFGGVQVEGVADMPIQLEINTGSPVASVFGRIGDVIALQGDYAAFYAPLGSGLPPGGTPGQTVVKTSLLDFDARWGNPASAQVSSVFGRIGAIVAAPGDYSAAQVTNAVSITGSYANPSWITSLAWAKITGAPVFFSGKFTDLDFTGSNLASIATRNFADLQNKPTTLGGYGITDAQPLDADLTAIAALTTTSFGRGFLTQTDGAASRTYIGAQVAGSYEPALGNPSSNGQVLSSTTSGARSWITPSAAAPVSSVFTRTGAIVALAGDYSAFYPSLSGTYTDPSWITSLAWSKITGAPAAPVTSVFTRTGAIAAASGDYSAFYPLLSGSYPNPTWITSLAWSKITGAPAFEPGLGNPTSDGQVLSSTAAGVRSWITTSGAAPVSSVFTRTGAVVALSGDYSAFYPMLTGSYADPSWITALAWSKITGAPAAPVSSVFTRTGAVVAAANDYTFAQIGSKPTTLAGYGITDPVVLTSGSYPNPTWITSLAYAKITGVPASPVYASLQTASLSPAAITVASPGRMLGLGVGNTLTPTATGKVHVTICGCVGASVAGTNPAMQIRWGTGTPPANNAVPVGTVVGAQAIAFPISTAFGSDPGSLSALITGLAIGVPVWFDLQVWTSTAGNGAYMSPASISAIEIP